MGRSTRGSNDGRCSTKAPSEWGATEKNAKMPCRSKTDWDAVLAASAARRKIEHHEEILQDLRRIDAKWRPKIPKIRKFADFEAYKNRFHDLDEQDHAIEVLETTPGLELNAQISREQTLRRKEKMASSRQKYLAGREKALSCGYEIADFRLKVSKSPSGDDNTKNNEKAGTDGTPIQGAYMQRVRINSQAILGHLTSLLGETEKRSTPRTFMRPFKPLVYFQPKMKEILDSLEEKWADKEAFEEFETEVSNEDIDTSDGEDGQEDDDNESLCSLDSDEEDLGIQMDGIDALKDMRCYVDFIENEVMPLYNQFNDASAIRVRFDDLWALFRVGDLIHTPPSDEIAGRYHGLWRIYRVKSPLPNIKYPNSGSGWLDDIDDDGADDRFTKFVICAYYIDHDGAEFGAVRHKFFIEPFLGERPIDSLEAFPLRFAENHGNLLSTLKKQGSKFKWCLEPQGRHQTYNAWTLTQNPPHDPEDYNDRDAEVLRDTNGDYWRQPEYVESDVIVDMSEAYHNNPDWRPKFHRPRTNKSLSCTSEEDKMKIQQWLHGSRTELAFAQAEIIQMTDGIELRQRQENLELDAFLKQTARRTHFLPRLCGPTPKPFNLREEDLALLPKRMFAYALRERRFLPIDINFLQPVNRGEGVFDSLRISKDHKNIVRGLVASHRRYAEMATEGPSQDLIQGKGRGLVVLLHGVPGVGKTATAEAVAMEHQKPLLIITCGDLGLTSYEVEKSLTKIFRLAHMWDCMLLLDEADVFLSQRSNQDMKRNALVSVFLRVLEYYNGILFLTTNRVGAIDVAFKSRIHMSLYYPPLDKNQTREIFRLNIDKLREIERQRHALTGSPCMKIMDSEIMDFAAKHFEDNAPLTRCWNGRQIRNAFQIASSLAHHSYSEQVALAHSHGHQPPPWPVLDRSLFEMVQMSTASFDRHLKEFRDMPLRSTFKKQDS